jgi:hypothetical protein
MDKAIEAMKLAFEALDGLYMPNELERVNKAITAIKEALKEHAMQEVQRLGQEIEQAPVAHCKVRPLRGDESFPKVEIDWVNQPVPGPLYTSPPQRKPLTYCQECMRPNPIDGSDCAHEAYKSSVAHMFGDKR